MLNMIPKKSIRLLSSIVFLLAHSRPLSSTQHATAAPTDALPEKRPRIHGGWDTQENRYSYAQVNLKFREKGHQCGGSLVAPDMVLTAGHCSGSFDVIEIGKHEKNDITDYSEEFVSELEIVHPEYNETTTRFDIMLVKLKGRTSQATPVRINKDQALPINDMMLTVIGMGYNGAWELPDVFQEATVRYQINDKCDDIVDEHGITLDGDLYPDMLCAGFGGKDSCYGDSGSPLVMTGQTEEEDVQIGLVSWGYECAGTLPGIYSRLSYLPTYNFIEKNVCLFSEEPPDNMDCDKWTGSPTVTPSRIPTKLPTPPPSAKPTTVIPTESPKPTTIESPKPTTQFNFLAENVFLHDLDLTLKTADIDGPTSRAETSSAVYSFSYSYGDVFAATVFGILGACTLF